MEHNILTNSNDTSLDVDSFIAKWRDEDSCIIQNTSGSTGNPKEIKIPKWKMKASAELTNSFFKLSELNSSLICMSPKYIGGKMMIVRSLIYNLKMTITPINSNPLKDLNHQIDFAAMVPLQVEKIITENPEKLNLIKFLIIGGAPVSKELENELQQFNCSCYATFGMTETISHFALRKLNNQNEPYRTLGDASIQEDNGELTINCPSLEISDLKTTDVIKLIDNKTFYWLGRSDFVINSGGIKLHPEQIESKLSGILSGYNFFVFSKADKELGSKVVMIIERESEIETLSQQLKKYLDKYEVPKNIYYLNKFKYTSSGKIDRNKTILKLNIE